MTHLVGHPSPSLWIWYIVFLGQTIAMFGFIYNQFCILILPIQIKYCPLEPNLLLHVNPFLHHMALFFRLKQMAMTPLLGHPIPQWQIGCILCQDQTMAMFGFACGQIFISMLPAYRNTSTHWNSIISNMSILSCIIGLSSLSLNKWYWVLWVDTQCPNGRLGAYIFGSKQWPCSFLYVTSSAYRSAQTAECRYVMSPQIQSSLTCQSFLASMSFAFPL